MKLLLSVLILGFGMLFSVPGIAASLCEGLLVELLAEPRDRSVEAIVEKYEAIFLAAIKLFPEVFDSERLAEIREHGRLSAEQYFVLPLSPNDPSALRQIRIGLQRLSLAFAGRFEQEDSEDVIGLVLDRLIANLTQHQAGLGSANALSQDPWVPKDFFDLGTLVYTARHSPDGSKLWTIGHDKKLRTWKNDAQPLQTLATRAQVQTLDQAEVSPDGSRFVLVDDSAHLFDHHGNLIKTLERSTRQHGQPIAGIAFSKDSQRIVTVDNGWEVRVFNHQGDLLHVIPEKPGAPLAFGAIRPAFTNDGAKIVAPYGKTGVRIIDALNGEVLRTLPSGVEDGNACAVSADSSRIVVGGRTGAVMIALADGVLTPLNIPSNVGPVALYTDD
jgi:WD40 repeat protein